MVGRLNNERVEGADLRKGAPAGLSSVETSDHEAFTHPGGRPWGPEFPDRIHPFRNARGERRIGHFVTKSKNAARMMVLKGWDVPRRSAQ